jgi:hypothetical protein
MFVTPRVNISDLEDCSYPTINFFPLLIQLFDVKFMAIVPHCPVVYQLQYARHIKKTLSINKHIYITLKVSGKKNTYIHINNL